MAPADYHLLVEHDKTFALTVVDRVNYTRPAIDALFESAAFVYGARLSGANSDGAQGTVFTIFIPIADSRETDLKKEKTMDAHKSSESILLVDDEPSITKVGKRMLEGAGYDVIIANKPCDALDLFKEKPEKFDLVMTDMTMPGMNGHKRTERIRKIRPDIPVVLCSGYQNKHVMGAEMKHL